MKILYCSFLLVCATHTSFVQNKDFNLSLPPGLILTTNQKKLIAEDALSSSDQLIRKYGYPVEIHNVTTADGYILTMFRVPYSPHSNSTAIRPVVLLQHGLLASSADWLLTGPGKSFAYILADIGFDVWLGNARGTTYSRKHLTLSPNESKFWDFSWHELGIYDLPAMIDYVLENTNQEKLFYIGHSQGSTMFFVLMSEMPEYNNKIRLMICFAPVAFRGRARSATLRFAAIPVVIAARTEYTEKFGASEFHPNNKLLAILAQAFCSDDAFSQFMCANILFFEYGYNKKNLNHTLIPVLLGHDPAGCSTKQQVHYAQAASSGRFRQYDHGYWRNRKIYGRNTPPDYDLSKTTSKVALFYSLNDYHVDVTDTMQLYNKLPNALLLQVEDVLFSHIDFMYGLNAKQVLYNRALDLMQYY